VNFVIDCHDAPIVDPQKSPRPKWPGVSRTSAAFPAAKDATFAACLGAETQV
jgi:hypothetical protein